MKKVTISTFSLRVKTLKDGDVIYYNLDKLPLSRKQSGRTVYKSLLDLLEEYLRRIKRQPFRDVNDQCVLTASNLNTEKRRSVSAFLMKGEYGIQNDLLHVKKREVLHRRSVDDAEMLPYYLLAAIPQGRERGVIVFQMEGEAGLKRYFERCFEDFLRQKCGDCDLEIDRLVPETLLKQYINNGRVARIRFVHLSVPKSIEDVYNLGNVAENATIELQVKARRGAPLLLARNIMQRYRDGQDFVQVKGYEFDTVKVDVKVGKSYRTIDLATPARFRADYDITGEVVMAAGHPTFSTIDPAGRKIVREIMQSLGMDIRGV